MKQRWDPNSVVNWVHGMRSPGDPETDDTAKEYAEQTNKFVSVQWVGMF